MLKKKVIEEFLKLNPDVKEDELIWRADGRLEWECEHNIGHTVYEPKGREYIHGCDGCCKRITLYVLPEHKKEPQENGHDDWADEFRWYGS